MPHLELARKRDLSANRKVALGTWRTSDNPSIFALLELTMNPALDYIREFREATGRRLTVTHLLAKAVAEAMHRTPDANALLRWNSIYLRKRINVFMPVMMDPDGTEGTAVEAVTINDAADKNLMELSDEMSEKVAELRRREDPAAERGRHALALIPSLLIGLVLRLLAFITYTLNLNLSRFGFPADPYGSVMITNVGMLGIDTVYAPLVPHSRVPVVFAAGAVQPRPVVEDDQLVIRQRMNITITIDHRFIDGHHLATLLGTLREWVEHPHEHFDAIPRHAAATSVEASA